MKATEFCYWLQGAFEIAGLSAFDSLHISCIKKHLALVRVNPLRSEPPESTEFCDWLSGGIDFIRPGDAEQTKTVRDRLSSVFEHAIDPGYPNQDQLNAIHNGSGKPYIPHKPGMRC